ncbi:hypothetical protein AB3X52_13390 [Nocardioides sp. DS6]|uniref:Restriction endonuclease n=1 Tax=Nocardioides eburneus TaxID=3231482 RepID=A0ABV3T0A2_9ACTN
MRETTYSRLLLDAIVPTRDPRLARAVTDGLLESVVRGPLRDAPTMGDLHAWTVNGPPAPDGALGFGDDTAAIALEVKRAHSETRSNATNWHARVNLRTLCHTHGAKDDISRLVYDAYLADTEPRLDAPHFDPDCCGTATHCGDSGDMWKVARGTGMHYPVVHQADTYAATTRWIPAGLAASSPRDFAFLLISPSGESTRKFLDGLVSEKVWSVASLPLALDCWAACQDEVPAMGRLIAATRAFLPNRADA